jgi:hypothetical protein
MQTDKETILLFIMIKALIIIIGIYLILRWTVRLFLPPIVNRQMNNFKQQFYQENPDLAPKKRQPEGKVTVEKTQPNRTKANDDGDYIDYEEIK